MSEAGVMNTLRIVMRFCLCVYVFEGELSVGSGVIVTGSLWVVMFFYNCDNV